MTGKSILIPLAAAIITCAMASCNSMYVSASSRGGNVGLPGQEESYSRPGHNKYPANTGAVKVFGSMDELKEYNYEPLTSLTESNNSIHTRTRAEMISSLQRRAAERGANAIAIVDERESAGEIERIRVNAVRLLGNKDSASR